MSQENYLEVSFEDFIRNPSSHIQLIANKLKLENVDEDRKGIIFDELQIPRDTKVEDFGYWKLNSNFNFDTRFKEMRSKYKFMLLRMLDEYSKKELVL